MSESAGQIDALHLVDTKDIPREMVVEVLDPLKIEIPDDELVRIIDTRIEDIRNYYEVNYDLYEVRKRNESYRFGRQYIDLGSKLKSYESREIDNVLYEIEATLKPLDLSEVPDMIVTPGNSSQESSDNARLLTKVVDSDIKSQEVRKVLSLASQHRPVYRVGCIKCLWNPQLMGGLGDVQFINIHPNNIEVDYTATEPDADKMNIVPQLVKMTVKDVLMKFPKAETKFKEQLGRDGIKAGDDGQLKWKDLATVIKIREVWFKDYKKMEDGKYQMISGVCWKYKDCVLGKMKNPYFDYEGSDQIFAYDNPELESSKRPVTEDEMKQSLITGQFPAHVKQDKVYRNYFASPRVPYYFMTYDQWGKQPLDETTAFEQNVQIQHMLDKRIKQVNETLANRGHHIWSKESGLKSSMIEKMDHNNPDEDYVVDGDVSKVHEFIPPERPTQQEFQDIQMLHDRMFALSGSNASRGELHSNTPATSTQIAREANYTRADDRVDDTINPASTWIAQWKLHMIKLFYTKEHFRWLLGAKGELLYTKLHSNMVEEGMEVMIKASGTDKLKAQNNALEMAKMQLTEPLSFFKDMGLDDAEGRTIKLLLFKSNPQAYAKNFLQDKLTETPDLLQAISSMVQPPAPAAPASPPMPPGAPASGPQLPTPTMTPAAPASPQLVPVSSPRGL